jgi:hypothetical protein
MKLGSYPDVYRIGHAKIDEILSSEVTVQEKVDGSQFSFSLVGGHLYLRSKGVEIDEERVPELFKLSVNTVIGLKDKLTPNYVYRCESIVKPKHNTLTYDRIPKCGLILFDIQESDGTEKYLSQSELRKEAERLGLEIVPCFFENKIVSVDKLTELLNTPSVLGGSIIEGVVIKNYQLFTRDKKVMMGKIVRDEFKEDNCAEWKKNQPYKKDFIIKVGEKYRSIARWRKSIIHLEEKDLLTHSPKDIGKLIDEIRLDIEKECIEEIKDDLYKHFSDTIMKVAIKDFAIWYKEELEKSKENELG